MEVTSVRRAIPQILALAAKNLLLICWGLQLGFPTILIPSLQGNGDLGETILLDENGISWIGSLTHLCVPIGSLLSGPLTSTFGRRRSMQIINIPFLAAWFIYHFSSKTWHIFVAMALSGTCGGLLEAPVITYAAEVTEQNLRGALTTTTFFSLSIGTLVTILLGSITSWRTVALFNAVIPVVALVALNFVPESPYWLLSKNKENDAKNSLAWLRGWVSPIEVEEEYSKLKAHVEKEPFSAKFSWKTIKTYFEPKFLKPFALITFAFLLYHVGNTPLVTYSIPTYTLLRAPINAYHATVYMNIAPIISCILSTISVRFIGKRVLTFISLGGEICCLVLLATYTYAIGAYYFDQPVSSSHDLTKYNFLPLVGMIGHNFFAFLMIRLLPWMLTGELFTNDHRSLASGICGGVAYFIGFLTNKIFLSLVRALTMGGVFLFFAGLTLLGLLVMYFVLPETEGKSLQHTSGHFSGEGKLDNKVYKKPMNIYK